MQTNHFAATILGTIHYGQAIAVECTHRSVLRVLSTFTRRLSLRLGGWRALERMPAAMPAMATCPSNRASRFQRKDRWMPGVVVDAGTVGVV